MYLRVQHTTKFVFYSFKKKHSNKNTNWILNNADSILVIFKLARIDRSIAKDNLRVFLQWLYVLIFEVTNLGQTYENHYKYIEWLYSLDHIESYLLQLCGARCNYVDSIGTLVTGPPHNNESTHFDTFTFYTFLFLFQFYSFY